MSATHGTSGVDVSPVPGYEIVRTLNEGGMGKIHLARQDALNRLVCVKVMSIPPGVDADLCRSRFCREAELLASVTHPHILSIFHFGATADQGLPFLVTEYIEGGDLRARLKPEKPMPVAQARSILLQVSAALTHLHEKGILHRDLKPENILMPTDSLVKVGDFGIAVMRDKAGTLTESSVGLGTVGYVSPEQQYGLKVDERTDLYSLAALCYELLTGRRPLGSFAPPSRLAPRLTHEVDAVVLRGLAEEPKNRYATVAEFINALDQALIETSRRARWPRLALACLIASLLALGARSGILTSGWNGIVGGGERRAANAVVAKPATVRPLPPPELNKPKQIEVRAPERSPEFHRLTELRAYGIWVRRGRPTGPEGERVKDQNWNEAEHQIESEVKFRAFTIWEKQGRPTGAAGDAVRDENMRVAATELLRETEDELHRHPLD